MTNSVNTYIIKIELDPEGGINMIDSTNPRQMADNIRELEKRIIALENPTPSEEVSANAKKRTVKKEVNE